MTKAKTKKGATVSKKITPPAAPQVPISPPKKQGLFEPIPIPDPPEKDEIYDEDLRKKSTPGEEGKKHKKKSHGIGAGLAGHVLVKQLLGTAPKVATNPANSEIKLEELDEKLLRVRLEALDVDLATYKEKCTHYKNENEWYRQEIESCEKDTTDYIRYLISKKEEKQATIDTLQEGKKKDLEMFAQKRRDREEYNKIKIEELKKLIVELELKLESKQQEMMSLSDVISKRSRHEAEIIKIKQDTADADKAHNDRVSALERSLLETRIRLQREADLKIQEMESAAQEKAAKYLAEHTAALEVENKKLEMELRKCIINTQELLKKKDLIERENHALEREHKVREDLLRLRIQRVIEAQAREKKALVQKKERVMSAKKDVFRKLSLKYPSLKRDGMLPSTVYEVSDTVKPGTADSAPAISRATPNTRLKTKLNTERPVMKLVVLAGSDRVEALESKDKKMEDKQTSIFSDTKWEISDGEDDEFL